MNDKFVLEIVPRSLDDQAADALRMQILSGHFPPGFRLIETRLAEQLNLSRGTIRAALHQLTHEGLVTQVLHKGWTVTTLTLHDTWELYTLRNVLEGFAARLVAESISPEQITILNQALQHLSDAVVEGDLKQITDADFSLHKAIVQCSGHQRLQDQYKLIEQQIHLYIAYCDTLFPDLTVLTVEHEQLVAAICSGDGSLAEQTARNHNADGKIFTRHAQTLE
ncbi:GntR family transcriptional regulator [Oculatella sp. LEGE 06141]|uniref:GntR family transcriptional regulator n=1 Tax=Oculatella sp. LEGE 06141 TaxID=1828648 RepID=UPI0018801B80|nr:GntR family transcriptional regulator [Oculatella sp. LEGE 06141]MBE9178946.1 GntR family transcriptional regulator [Oculatella sp. LEGE 06141]